MSLRSLTEQEQKEAKEWFFEKYKDTPYYDDIFNIVSKIKRGELNKTSLKEYKKAVHIDFPNNEIMMEVFEDLLLAFPDEWDLLHKNSNKKSMIHNRKAQRRFMEWEKIKNSAKGIKMVKKTVGTFDEPAINSPPLPGAPAPQGEAPSPLKKRAARKPKSTLSVAELADSEAKMAKARALHAYNSSKHVQASKARNAPKPVEKKERKAPSPKGENAPKNLLKAHKKVAKEIRDEARKLREECKGKMEEARNLTMKARHLPFDDARVREVASGYASF